jgi:hypothetical protein
MSGWFDRLRFLWAEEFAPPPEVAGARRGEPAGVPMPLRRATRFALISVLATSLMGEIIGVRLIAPVDAAPKHAKQCEKDCKDASKTCQDACPKGNAGKTCKDNCKTTEKSCIQNCSL